MDDLGLHYHPRDMDISRRDLEDSLLALKSFTEKRGHWYSIIEEAVIDAAVIEAIGAGLRF